MTGGVSGVVTGVAGVGTSVGACDGEAVTDEGGVPGVDGENVGVSVGAGVGIVVGSFDGAREGVADGRRDGVRDGVRVGFCDGAGVVGGGGTPLPVPPVVGEPV